MRSFDFGYDLGTASDWGRLERRIATAGVRAYLIEPTDEKRRVRVRHVLLAAELKMLEKDALAEPPKDELLAALKGDLVAALVEIAKEHARRHYAKALSFDLDEERARRKMGRNIPGIMGAGLIVEVMREAARPGEEQTFGVEAPKKTIRARHRKNAWFERNETGQSRAWRRYRPVAHFAAALLRFIWDHDLRRFGGEELKTFRANIVEFLEVSNFYQHFIHDLSVQPRLRFPYDLYGLPTELGLGRKKPEGDLVYPEGVLR